MYAEELCFAPKYVRLKQLLDEGALGRPDAGQAVREARRPARRRSSGTSTRSGGGVTMDMGCHAIEFFRWMLRQAGQRPRCRASTRRWAPTSTPTRRSGDDNAILILEFDRAAPIGHRRGELDQARRHGRPRRGPRLAGRRLRRPAARQRDPDLQHRAATATRSRRRASTEGWSFTIYEEAWNYGFPQEMAHFVDCVQDDEPPLVTGEDGRAVLEAIFAAYESAGTGRKVTLPFKTDARKPIDLWWSAE